MSHGLTRIASKGACIYCGAVDVKLTDEHIVPLALGGQHIICEASCLACSKITTKFERDVARGLWGDARTSYNAPSRRKNERKTHIILSNPDIPDRKVKVPYSDYPAPMVFYRMSRAGVLEGLPDSVDLSAMWELVALSDSGRNKEFERKYETALTAKFRHVPVSFARLLAKIGYGQILYLLDPGDFRSICVPYIMGQKSNPSFIVGGMLDAVEPADGMGYVLRTSGFGTSNRLMLMAEIRLFANNYVPTYHVAVGDVWGRDKVAAVLAKLGDIQIEMIPPFTATMNSSIVPHWMPRCWPLPFWNE